VTTAQLRLQILPHSPSEVKAVHCPRPGSVESGNNHNNYKGAGGTTATILATDNKEMVYGKWKHAKRNYHSTPI